MKSQTVSSFWEAYEKLDRTTRERAKKVFSFWSENPFHPSLHFKCVYVEGSIWSVRITKNYRALCVWEEDTATWFWIGSHDEYERLI